uniref:Uncharacterized protein n=2 Tax=Parascaris TaxID=6254 RepID=A0A914ZHT8_PARUN
QLVKMSEGSGRGGRKRAWRYTPPLPTDSDNRAGENVRTRNQLDSSTSFTQSALSGVLENLVSEVRSLHALISHNADQEEAHYRVLLNENRSLKRALGIINAKMTKLSPDLIANESETQNETNISQHSNKSRNESIVHDAEDRADSVEAELRDVFARSHHVNIPGDAPSEVPFGDIEESSRVGYRTAVKNEYFNGVPSGKEASRGISHDGTSGSTSSRSRELMETTESLQEKSLIGSGGVRADRRMTRSRARARSNKRVGSAKEPSDEEVCHQGEEDDHLDDDEDEVRPKERVIIKPLPTDLPKPTTFRVSGGYRGQSKMTDEWKEYALSIYPIRPHQYWDIRKEDYEALIPDQYLEEFKKDPTEREKNSLIRSIYDWFRYQHRIAQLKVVLSECTTAMDVDSLRKVYVEKMKQRGWPVYGKKLRKCEVTVARKQLIESFLDGTMPGF